MPGGYETALSDYESFDFSAGDFARKVYARGRGPAAIVLHEIPGLHPLVVRFADHDAEDGPTKAAEQRVIAFLKAATTGAAAP